MKIIAVILSASFTLFSCSTSSVKEKINQAGDVAGQVAGEFAEGAGKGLIKAFDVKVSVSETLTAKGIQLGKTTVTSDTLGTDNLLVAYVIFNNDFKGSLTAKVVDENGLETGRSTIQVEGIKNDAQYIEFLFDKRTNIDSKNLVTIE